ncbi:MAG TPA: hypothetical protein VE442_23505 [Jatrophihabitans sp.]|nr:hypothetical protein [Jatrophihabitans sp.]
MDQASVANHANRAAPRGGPDGGPAAPGPAPAPPSVAKRPDRAVARSRPPGLGDADVAALGKLSEALEVVEHARGLLYGFHRLCGTADLTLQEAVRMLRAAGHPELADEIDEALVGRDVVDDMWSFQLVDKYDTGYWQPFRDIEQRTRAALGDAAAHIYEAEMKFDEQRGKLGAKQE